MDAYRLKRDRRFRKQLTGQITERRAHCTDGAARSFWRVILKASGPDSRGIADCYYFQQITIDLSSNDGGRFGIA